MIYTAADIHLGKSLRKKDIFKRDSYVSFEDMVNKIIDDDEESKSLILAGDILEDNYITGDSLDILKRNIEKLKDNNIELYTLMGNHDYGEKSIPETQGAVNLNEKAVEIDGYTVYGIDYRPPEIIKEKINEAPECDILFLHQTFKHMLDFEDVYNISVYDIPGRIKNVVCGDIHIIDKRKTGNGYFLSPGSLHPNKLDEDYNHGFWKFTGDDFEFIPVYHRKILRLSITDKEDIKEAEKSLKELPEDPYSVAEVKYRSEFQSSAESLEDKYGNIIFITSVIPEESDDNISENISAVSTMEDKLPEEADPEENSELYYFAENLLKKDTDKVIKDKIEEKGIAVESD